MSMTGGFEGGYVKWRIGTLAVMGGVTVLSVLAGSGSLGLQPVGMPSAIELQPFPQVLASLPQGRALPTSRSSAADSPFGRSEWNGSR